MTVIRPHSNFGEALAKHLLTVLLFGSVLVPAYVGAADPPNSSPDDPKLRLAPWLRLYDRISTLSPSELAATDYSADACRVSTPDTVQCHALRIESRSHTGRHLRAEWLSTTPRSRTVNNLKMRWTSQRLTARRITWKESGNLTASGVTLFGCHDGRTCRNSDILTIGEVEIRAGEERQSPTRVVLTDLRWRRDLPSESVDTPRPSTFIAERATWGSGESHLRSSGWKFEGRKYRLGLGWMIPVGVGGTDGRSAFGVLPPAMSFDGDRFSGRWLTSLTTLNLLAGPTASISTSGRMQSLGGAVGVAAPTRKPAVPGRSIQSASAMNPISVEVAHLPNEGGQAILTDGEWDVRPDSSDLSTSGELETLNHASQQTPYHTGESGAFRDWTLSTVGVGHRGPRHDSNIASSALQTTPSDGFPRWRFQSLNSGSMHLGGAFDGSARLAYGGVHAPSTSDADDRHRLLAETLVGWGARPTRGLRLELQMQMASQVELVPQLSQSDNPTGTRTDSMTALFAGAHGSTFATARFGNLLHRLGAEVSVGAPAFVVRDSGPTDAPSNSQPVGGAATELPGVSGGEFFFDVAFRQSLETPSLQLSWPVGFLGDTNLHEGEYRLTPYSVATALTDDWNLSVGIAGDPSETISFGGDIIYRLRHGYVGYAYALGGRRLPWILDAVYRGSRPSQLIRTSRHLNSSSPEESATLHRLHAGIQVSRWDVSTSLSASGASEPATGVTLRIEYHLPSLGWELGATGLYGGPTQTTGATVGLATR